MVPLAQIASFCPLRAILRLRVSVPYLPVKLLGQRRKCWNAHMFGHTPPIRDPSTVPQRGAWLRARLAVVEQGVNLAT